MKKFASHYLYIPNHGYLKMHGIEVSHGRVERIFPVTGESENTVWLPGVIALEGEGTEARPFNIPTIIDAIPLDLQAYSGLSPYWYSPFDLTALRPVDGTRRTRLQ